MNLSRSYHELLIERLRDPRERYYYLLAASRESKQDFSKAVSNVFEAINSVSNRPVAKEAV